MAFLPKPELSGKPLISIQVCYILDYLDITMFSVKHRSAKLRPATITGIFRPMKKKQKSLFMQSHYSMKVA